MAKQGWAKEHYEQLYRATGTVRVDDPLLTIRPHRTRVKPYARVVVCETAPVSHEHRVFDDPSDAPSGSYRQTIVLAPAAAGRAIYRCYLQLNN